MTYLGALCVCLSSSLHDVARPANVVHFVVLNIVSEVVGWLYFIMWSVSFYPQVSYQFTLVYMHALGLGNIIATLFTIAIVRLIM